MNAWERAERELAKRLGGRRQPGSGCGTYRKGDIDTERYLVEVKTTKQREEITLHRVWFDKILLEAEQCNKQPLLVIRSTSTHAEWCFVLERQKPEPSDPGWKTRKFRIYPLPEAENIESLCGYWTLQTVPPSWEEDECEPP